MPAGGTRFVQQCPGERSVFDDGLQLVLHSATLLSFRKLAEVPDNLHEIVSRQTPTVRAIPSWFAGRPRAAFFGR